MHFSVLEFLQHLLPSFTCEQQPIRGVFYLVWEQLSLASCTPSVSVCETSRCIYGLITCTELVDYLKHRKQLTVAICSSLQVDRQTIRGHIQANHDPDGNTWCHVGSCEGSYQVYRINLRGVAKTGGKSEEWPQYGVSASHQYWAAFGKGSWLIATCRCSNNCGPLTQKPTLQLAQWKIFLVSVGRQLSTSTNYRPHSYFALRVHLRMRTWPVQ